MKYNVPYGYADEVNPGDHPYVNGDPSIGRAGSIPPAESIEYPQREIVNFITDSGLVGVNTDLHQLSKAVQNGQVVWAIDSGTANAIIIGLTPAVTALVAGMMFLTKIAATNSGATTCVVNGLTAKQVVRRDGTQLLDADLKGGALQLLAYDGTKFQVIGTLDGGSGGRRPLTRNLDIYVNGAIGNDSNDGISNTAGHALATPQGAINLAYSYQPSQYFITIHIASGTYASCGTPGYAGPNLIMLGDTTTPHNVIIGGSTTVNAILLSGPNYMKCQGIEAYTGGSGPVSGFVAFPGATLEIDRCRSGICQVAAIQANGGSVNMIGNFTASANCGSVLNSTYGGRLVTSQDGITIDTSAAITVTYYAFSFSLGVITVAATRPTFSNSGNVTGKRYRCEMNGIIDTQSGGATIFPGTVSGDTGTGGQYA